MPSAFALPKMPDQSPAYAAYFCAELICCLVLLDILLYWYYNVFHLRSVNISLLGWHYHCSTHWKYLVVQILLRFIPFQVTIGVLIWFCLADRELQPPQIPFRPIGWLLAFSLWTALSFQISALWRLCRRLAEAGRPIFHLMPASASVIVVLSQASGTSLSQLKSHRQSGCALIALGSFLTHALFISVPIFLICEALCLRELEEPFRIKAIQFLKRTDSWGALCTTIIGIVAAVASMILLLADSVYLFLLGECIVACVIIGARVSVQAWKYHRRGEALRRSGAEGLVRIDSAQEMTEV